MENNISMCLLLFAGISLTKIKTTLANLSRSGKFLIAKLQSVQTSAAGLLCMTRTFDHIALTLIDLHWLPIRHRIVFKILLSVHKSLNAKALSYLSDV